MTGKEENLGLLALALFVAAVVIAAAGWVLVVIDGGLVDGGLLIPPRAMVAFITAGAAILGAWTLSDRLTR